MAYFDTSTVSGFTIRVYYEEDLGVVTITNLQVQSTLYQGTWYPTGTIKINGETVLSLSSNTPTHAINGIGAGSTWWPIHERVSAGVYQEITPVSSEQIFATATTITVDINLYRSSDGVNIRGITGSTTVSLTTGLVYIGADLYQAYVGNGTGYDLCIPYIGNGSGYGMCSA